MSFASKKLAAETAQDGRDVPGYCTFCRSRCGSLNRIEHGRLVSVRPNPEHPTGKALCPKGRAAPELVGSARRLTKPMVRTRPKGDADPGFKEVDWDEALDFIASKLQLFADESGPESVAFSFSSPSATSISDDLPWLERFVWNFGSPNICWATELCNWHKDHMHKLTLGTGLPTPDYANSDLIVLWGHNPEKVWLAQAEVIARALRRGAELVVIDPRRTGMAGQASQWLKVRPGTDGALALALMRLLIEERGVDASFVREWSNAPFLVREDNGAYLRSEDLGLSPSDQYLAYDGRLGEAVPVDTKRAPEPGIFEAFDLDACVEMTLVDGTVVNCRTAFSHMRLACAPYSPERAAEICWIEADEIRQLAHRIAAAGSISYYCWTGVGQHANATQTDRAIACLFALTGQYDVPGGNVVWPSLPVLPISDHATLGKEQAEKALGYADRPLGPASGGWITGSELYRAIYEEKPYKVRGLISFGSNVLSSQPDPQLGKAALEKLELHVHCDLFMNPSAMMADIVLPVKSAWERDALRAGFEISLEAQQHLQLRPAMVAPRGEARSDFEIAAALAERLGFGEAFANGDWDAAHDEVLAPLNITTEQLRRAPGGVSVQLSHNFKSYAAKNENGAVKGFRTPTRRVEIYSELLHKHGYSAVPDFVPPTDVDERHPLVLTTAKSGYYCHTQHRGLSGLRRKSPKPRVDIHPDTASARGIAEFDRVEVVRHGKYITMEAHYDADLHPGVIVAEYGWWQAAPDIGEPAYEIGGRDDANYNSVATFDRLDPISGAPGVRSLCCDVRPVERTIGHQWTGFRRLRVVEKSTKAPDVTALKLEAVDGKPLAAFRAGQFISMRPSDTGISRSYSLIGCPEPVPMSYEIAIRRMDEGELSGALSDTLVGENVEVTRPSGNFILPVENEFPVVLIATGIGITPFMSLLEQIDRRSGPEIWLYYGSRNSTHHAFRERIADIESRTPNLRVFNFYSRASNADSGPHIKGRITVDDIDPELFRRRARFYMCGSDEMLENLGAGLKKRGVPDFEIFTERFTVRRNQPATDLKPRDVFFARQNKKAKWSPEDGSILDLAEKNKLALSAGCRTGQCESCAVSVISGDYAYFVDIEEQEPDICLACQAYPVSDIVLDA